MTELSIGRISINGRVGQEPEIRYFASGSQVAKINLAVESYASGQKETIWFNDIEIWGPQADIVAKYVHVGDRVTIGGDYTVQEWQDKATGLKDFKYVFRGNSIDLDSRPRDKTTDEVPVKPVTTEIVVSEEYDEIPF